ncbi:hypothetical protein ACFXHA_10600 [Nocardia sp. NPDC059240]|uniref:hypothetical protein n=1 Tax=Nocardia sp. NPDC059240 TaxID=3346786 RepID=UPI00368CFA70
MTSMRRVFTRMVIAAVMALLAFGGVNPAAAEPYPAPQPADPMYPFAEVLQLLTGTEHDLSMPGALDYFLRSAAFVNLANAGLPFQDLLQPETWSGPDAPQRQLVAAQKIIDGILHLPPLGLAAPDNPAYIPNWSHDGNFTNNVSDAVLEDDYENPAAQEAKFRYPCVQPNADVLFENTDGVCVPGTDSSQVFKLGTVKKFQMVNNRGIKLGAKIFFPEGAEDSAAKYPVTVMLPGAAEKQADVNRYTLSAVRKGFIGISLAYSGNAAGTGGTIADVYLPQLKNPHLNFPGSARDVQDFIRWLNRAPITPIVDLNGDELGNLAKGEIPRLQRFNPAYAPDGDNQLNPWADLMDLDHVNLWGQSFGSGGITSYGFWQGLGKGFDGNPLPKVSSIVGMSGFSYTTADIPIQLQTADFDIPVPNGYLITPQPNGLADVTDGPIGVKEYYDNIRREGHGNSPLMFLTLEGGFHTDTFNLLGVIYHVKSPYLSTTSALNWFQCYGRADTDESACAALREPIDGMSRAFATEYSPEGPAGPSLCVTIPDRATLIQAPYRPADFIQNNWGPAKYDCTPQQR